MNRASNTIIRSRINLIKQKYDSSASINCQSTPDTISPRNLSFVNNNDDQHALLLIADYQLRLCSSNRLIRVTFLPFRFRSRKSGNLHSRWPISLSRSCRRVHKYSPSSNGKPPLRLDRTADIGTNRERKREKLVMKVTRASFAKRRDSGASGGGVWKIFVRATLLETHRVHLLLLLLLLLSSLQRRFRLPGAKCFSAHKSPLLFLSSSFPPFLSSPPTSQKTMILYFPGAFAASQLITQALVAAASPFSISSLSLIHI